MNANTIYTNCATTLTSIRMLLGIQYGFDLPKIDGSEFGDTTNLVSRDGSKTAVIGKTSSVHGLVFNVSVFAA